MTDENAMIIPWDSIDPKYQWAAVDSQERLIFFQLGTRPRMWGEGWETAGAAICSKFPDFLKGAQRGRLMWRHTMQQRPSK